jgi:hypothetical protein
MRQHYVHSCRCCGCLGKDGRAIGKDLYHSSCWQTRRVVRLLSQDHPRSLQILLRTEVSDIRDQKRTANCQTWRYEPDVRRWSNEIFPARLGLSTACHRIAETVRRVGIRVSPPIPYARRQPYPTARRQRFK